MPVDLFSQRHARRNRNAGSAFTKVASPSNVSLKIEDILTPEEVAARLKVPDSWVYEKTRSRCRNPIPCLHIGRYIRFNWSAVVNWLTEGGDAERADISTRR
jgi:excisionase family DNA binding protein